MGFIYCRDCDWEQDDFWEVNGYNPFKNLESNYWLEILNNGINVNHIIQIDNWILKDLNIEGEKEGEVDFRRYLAALLREEAKNIENMHWVTYKDYKNDSDPKCPKCGSRNLVED